MLLLAKFAGILVLVWFYTSAKKVNGPAINWAIIGVLGYWLTWWLANKLLVASLAGMFSKNPTMIFMVTQIPVFVGLAAIFFIRKKLLASVDNHQ
ncbi:hypothetical protein [methane-oxidizing endosymbiont of Gigantopelta aegis]|uniref:hypothetical protein n=1 Tax=methane-oxidizing endosymbiont of Gigantopelta aegis TaxID=2794938 RepID=UPI0018DDEAB3|nr:hypothetical protein [methane-oxidizing endosymbiont of Gigantopelta aegis]